MEIKYTGMELKLHRHGIQTTLASVFGAMLIATPLVADAHWQTGHCDGKSFLVPPVDGQLMAIGRL